jgi:hypothetical protein
MPRAKLGPKSKLLEKMLSETSWTVSHAIGLKAVGRQEEADAEWRNAAVREEQVVFQLETEGLELLAAVHRISAASCYEEVREYPRAITLLRAALSVDLRPAYRTTIEKQLRDCLKRVRQPTRRSPRKTATVA